MNPFPASRTPLLLCLCLAAAATMTPALWAQAPNLESAARPLSTPSNQQDLRGNFPLLPVSGQPENGPTDQQESKQSRLFSGPLVTTLCSLTVVLAIFAGMVWVSRAYGNTEGSLPGSLPSDVLDNLGSASIDSKTRVTMLRCGQKIILVGQATGGELRTLSEINDPEEVERVTNRCKGRPHIVGRRQTGSAGENYPRQDRAVG